MIIAALDVAASSPSTCRSSDAGYASALSVTFAPGRSVKECFFNNEFARMANQIQEQVEKFRREVDDRVATQDAISAAAPSGRSRWLLCTVCTNWRRELSIRVRPRTCTLRAVGD